MRVGFHTKHNQKSIQNIVETKSKKIEIMKIEKEKIFGTLTVRISGLTYKGHYK